MKKSRMFVVCMIALLILASCSDANTEQNIVMLEVDEAEVETDQIENNPENEGLIENQGTSNNTSLENQGIQSDNSLSVVTIGTGTPAYSEEKAKASTAILYNGKYYIVDCGDGSYNNMIESEYAFDNIGGLFFTHHHIDHTTDFFDIYVKCMLSHTGQLSVVGPPRTQKFVDFVNEVYLDDVLYRLSNTTKNVENIDIERLTDFAAVTEVIGEAELHIDGITITTAEMTHTMYDLAYKFEVDGHSIVVSGDTSYDEDLITLAKGADILVIDGSVYKENTNENPEKTIDLEPIYEYGGNFEVDPHLSLEDMVTIATEADVKTLVITHYGDVAQNRIDSSMAIIKERFAGEVIYASDMMEIGIADIEEKKNEKTLDGAYTYPIVDTNQIEFYSDTSIIIAPGINDEFYGQDATYTSNQPAYSDSKDGTIVDHVTGLIWAKDMGGKMSYEAAKLYVKECRIGGYDDWRIPTIKELYSLIQFDGMVLGDTATEHLFIDTDYFMQPLGNISNGEREIDAQTWSSTEYVGLTMNGNMTIFGVNFIDGRIKGYPQYNKRSNADNEMYFRLVRGNTLYGENDFIDNGDGTISDLATGLTWQQDDGQIAMDWEEALSYAENLELTGYDDWRLPSAKELQSIVDYNRSLQTSNSPAIDEMFNTTPIMDIEGTINYPYFWTSTTHLDGINPYSNAVYIAFGEAFGEMNGNLMDVHGAGAQRSDPKSGSEEDYPVDFGPQGDIRYVYNYVRCVRDDR